MSHVTSLDDLAALLLQLEPGDTTELARVRDGLRELGILAEAKPDRQVLHFEAARRIDAVVRGAAADAAAELAAAGALLGRLMGEPAPAPLVAAPVQAAGALPTLDIPADADRELLPDFLVESRECLEGAEAALLALEHEPAQHEAINTVFRAFHTLKGTSAFLGLAVIADFAHHAESLLSRVRDGELAYTGEVATLALQSADVLRHCVHGIEAALEGPVPPLPDEYEEVLAQLQMMEEPGSEVPVPPVAAEAPRAEPASRDAAAGDRPPETGHRQPDAGRRTPEAGPGPVAMPDAVAERPTIPPSDTSVRVRTDRLDRLIDMVGELVIAQTMLAQDGIITGGQQVELARKVGHAGKIVRELQDLSMSMRMVPLKATFQKLARLVRDVARKAGKDVELVTEGEDTEIDRNMVDVIAESLVHMVRNSVDHGIEAPEARLRAGKPRQGVVRIAAFHQGGNVVVEIADDGRGLDRERIVAKALDKGLIADRQLSDNEAYALIFAPGFSTADRVTDLSGRGVGMDVVKRSIEGLRGRVDITSELGTGTTFALRLPLTLAVTDAMLVRVGRERYLVPTTNIHMSFRPAAGAISTIAGRGEMVLLRGELLPVVRVHRLFAVEGAAEVPDQALLMIVGDGERRTALLVDELLGQQQVVAKTLGKGLGKIPGVSGGAILGDGRVGLILDVAECVQLARQGEATGPAIAAPAPQSAQASAA